jgi:hypothetical protein
MRIADPICSNPKHTPEPWHSDETRQINLTPNAGTACRINTIVITAHVDPGTSKALAFIPEDEPEAQANARLIKAAPIMLDALQVLEKRCAVLGWSEPEMRIIRYAIAQATRPAA